MDCRTIKTKSAIQESFLYFLEKKNLSQITVSEITKKAQLGRGTFYLHYKDVFDLYDEISNNLYTDMEIFFDNAYPSNDSKNLKNLINTLTKYIEQNRSLINLEYFLQKKFFLKKCLSIIQPMMKLSLFSLYQV